MKFAIFFGVVLTLFWSEILVAEETDFYKIFDEILANDFIFQNEANKIKEKTAKLKIDISNNLLDLGYSRNVIRQGEISKSEWNANGKEKIELSNEEDVAKFEISKVFFERDFDTAFDIFSGKIDIVNEKFQLEIYRIKRLDEIISDYIRFYNARKNLEIAKQRFSLLKQEKEIAEKLYFDGVVSEEKMIDIINKIAEISGKIIEFESVIAEDGNNKNFSVFDNFFAETASQPNIEADTTSFLKKNSGLISELKREIKKLSANLKRRFFLVAFPEMKANISWNIKNTKEENSYPETETDDVLERKIYETYPEFSLEFSLPLNFIGNAKNKYALLRAFRNKAKFSEQKQIMEISAFQNEMLFALKQARSSLSSQTELTNLFEKKYEKACLQYETQPSLLGINPEISLKYFELENEKAKLELETAKLKYQKICFLINYYTRRNYGKK